MYCGWELLTADDEAKIARGVREGCVYGGPYHLSLFIVNRCDVRCFFCFASDMLKTNRVLDWPVLKAALLEAIDMDLRSVSFSGGGEPLLYPQLSSLLDLLGEHRVSIDFFNTNGIKLTPGLIDKLLAVGVREMTISLNETTPETYRRMMNCSPRFFDQVINAIHYIREAGERAGVKKPQVRLQLFIWRENFLRLEQMYDFAAGLKPDVIYLNTIEQLPETERMDTTQREACKKILTRVFQKDRQRKLILINLGQEGLQQFAGNELAKTNPQFFFIDGHAPLPQRIEYCYTGWFHSLIDAFGDVYPCCYLMGDSRHILGNVGRQSIREIWQGKDYQQFRGEMREIMLSQAKLNSDLSRWRFITPTCLARAACSFNLMLCSRQFYQQMDQWFESGPRQSYKPPRQRLGPISRFFNQAKLRRVKK